MASRVHHLTASATGDVLPEPNLLDLCRQLWTQQNLAGIESAAAELIGHLFPGIRTRLTEPDKAESDSHDRALRLPLDSDYQLELRPAPAGADKDRPIRTIGPTFIPPKQ